MFSKSTRPLYRLCQAIPLQRIATKEYENFLNRAAMVHWSKPLQQDAIAEILQLTECHPFYVNGLCNVLWMLDEPPQREEVTQQWADYIKAHKSILVSDIAFLPLNQKKVLQSLASNSTDAPYASEFCLKTKLPAASVRRAFEYLLKKDIVYRDDAGIYRLLDPAVRYYLLNY
jgi:hypothetical protein